MQAVQLAGTRITLPMLSVQCVGQRGSGATCSAAAQVLPHGRAGNATYPSKTPQHGM
jgi:hypothetical protein